jgi:phosphomannomutase
VVNELQPKEINLLDGIRLEFSDSWLLIRPSGTEPTIRILCESESKSRLEHHMKEGISMVEEALKGVKP